jgi:ribosome-associated protein
MDDAELGNGVVLPAAAVTWRFARSSGPGGQSVNTTDSKASASVRLDDLAGLTDLLRSRLERALAGRLVDGCVTVTSEVERSQLRNRERAYDRLVELLRAALSPPPAPRRPTRPSRGARERRIAGKRQRGEVKRLRGPVDDG